MAPVLCSSTLEGLLPDAGWLAIVLTVLGYLIPVALVPHVLLSRRDSGTTLAWIIFIVLVPFGGAFCYWMLGQRRLAKIQRRARVAACTTRRAYAPATLSRLDDPDLEALARVAKKSGAPPPLGGNAVRIFDDNLAAFEDMLASVDRAQRTVELEVFIFRRGGLGRRFMAALTRAVRRGVIVRFLVDGVGGFALGSRDTRAFGEMGGEFRRFLPIPRPRLRPHINFRLHRKLLVVDDRTCYLGSLNVADELLGQKPPWREVHARIDGPAAIAARETFEADWIFAGGRPRAGSVSPAEPAGDEIVQIVASGPNEPASATARLLFAAMSLAREEVLVATPYFVPGRRLLAAIESAALRGARVRIALPGTSDMGIVQAAMRTHVEWLREVGVSLVALPGSMLHAKIAVFDRRLAIVGSANMDARSLGLSFELNALLLGKHGVEQAHASVASILAASEPVLASPRPLIGRLCDACARVLSPVL